MQNKELEQLLNVIPQNRDEIFNAFVQLWKKIESCKIEDCLKIKVSIEQNYPHDLALQGCSMLLISSLNFIQNNYKDSILAGLEGKELFQNSNIKAGEGAINIIIGACYRSLGENDDALNYIKLGINQMPEQSIFNQFLVVGYYQGAEIFSFFNKYSDAIDYYTKGLRKDTDKRLKARILNGIGNIYLKQKKYDDALLTFTEANNLIEDKENKITKARILSDLSKYYIEVEEYDKALEFENQSIELRQNSNLKAFLVSNYLNLFKIYTKTLQNHKAFEALETAYLIANELDLKAKLAEIYEKKVEYYESQNDYPNALIELKKYSKSRENEIKASLDLKIKGINAVHEVEFTRKEAQLTKEKNQELSIANENINQKNTELKNAIDELTRTKISRKSVIITMSVGIALCILTEAFVDPIIDEYAYNYFISITIKVLIAISLKPIDSFYESYMLKQAISKAELI